MVARMEVMMAEHLATLMVLQLVRQLVELSELMMVELMGNMLAMQTEVRMELRMVVQLAMKLELMMVELMELTMELLMATTLEWPMAKQLALQLAQLMAELLEQRLVEQLESSWPRCRLLESMCQAAALPRLSSTNNTRTPRQCRNQLPHLHNSLSAHTMSHTEHSSSLSSSLCRFQMHRCLG